MSVVHEVQDIESTDRDGSSEGIRALGQHHPLRTDDLKWDVFTVCPVCNPYRRFDVGTATSGALNLPSRPMRTNAFQRTDLSGHEFNDTCEHERRRNG